MESCGQTASRLTDTCLRHPVITILSVALLVRLVLMPLLTYDYDIYHWAVIIQNFQSGNGLYDVAGYYYTPTWGYILGFVSMIMDALGTADVFGIRFTDLFPIESLDFDFHTATTTTIAFNIAMKIPLVIVDVVVALLLRWLIIEITGSEKKGAAGMILWLFCPTVIYMSGIQAQFDSISALMMLLTVILVYRDRCFLGGMIFGAAVLLKFFPGFTILVMVAYIIVKHREDGFAARRIIEAALGAGIMCIILFLPQLLDGTFNYTLGFIFGRMDMQSENGWYVALAQYALIAIALLGMIYAGYRMYKTDAKDADRGFFTCVLIALGCAMFISATPQYMMVMMPILILVMLMSEGRLRICWILITVGSFIGALANNNIMLLDSAAEYLGIVSPDWVVSIAEWIESNTIFGITPVLLINSLGSIIEYVGFIIIIALFFERKLSTKLPKMANALKKLKRWDFDETV